MYTLSFYYQDSIQIFHDEFVWWIPSLSLPPTRLIIVFQQNVLCHFFSFLPPHSQYLFHFFFMYFPFALSLHYTSSRSSSMFPSFLCNSSPVCRLFHVVFLPFLLIHHRPLTSSRSHFLYLGKRQWQQQQHQEHRLSKKRETEVEHYFDISFVRIFTFANVEQNDGLKAPTHNRHFSIQQQINYYLSLFFRTLCSQCALLQWASYASAMWHNSTHFVALYLFAVCAGFSLKWFATLCFFIFRFIICLSL